MKKTFEVTIPVTVDIDEDALPQLTEDYDSMVGLGDGVDCLHEALAIRAINNPMDKLGRVTIHNHHASATEVPLLD